MTCVKPENCDMIGRKDGKPFKVLCESGMAFLGKGYTPNVPVEWAEVIKALNPGDAGVGFDKQLNVKVYPTYKY